MRRYNPEFHHRRSIRKKGYDYSQAGLYYITICSQDRACCFGQVEEGEMILNDPGNMLAKWYDELGNKFPDIKCLDMVVMPNHLHCIVENVGADLRVCPNDIMHGTNDHVRQLVDMPPSDIMSNGSDNPSWVEHIDSGFTIIRRGANT